MQGQRPEQDLPLHSDEPADTANVAVLGRGPPGRAAKQLKTCGASTHYSSGERAGLHSGKAQPLPGLPAPGLGASLSHPSSASGGSLSAWTLSVVGEEHARRSLASEGRSQHRPAPRSTSCRKLWSFDSELTVTPVFLSVCEH